jgi:hypothetical protein
MAGFGIKGTLRRPKPAWFAQRAFAFGVSMFANLETHFTRFLASADARLHEGAQAFKEFFQSEEARVAAEVEHLKSLGMQVTKDGKEV